MGCVAGIGRQEPLLVTSYVTALGVNTSYIVGQTSIDTSYAALDLELMSHERVNVPFLPVKHRPAVFP